MYSYRVTARKPVQSYLELLLSIRGIVQPHFQQKAQLSSGHYIVRITLPVPAVLGVTVTISGH